jgi:hypothetical protein
MPQLSLAAKKFGGRSKHSILAWPKRGWLNFLKSIENAEATATAKCRPK